MRNYLLPRLQNIIDLLNNDLLLIARKNKDDEWKRDHYRYAFTLTAQRMFDLLNSQLTVNEVPRLSHSTKIELTVLKEKIEEMINSDQG